MTEIEKINSNGKDTLLLFDYSGIAYRTAYGLQKELVENAYTDWSIFKHYMMVTLIEYKMKFPKGKVIVCADYKNNGKYWRHRIFPNYKHHRKSMVSSIPKDILIKEINIVLDDITENTPWYDVRYPGCEGDDIIAVLATEYANENIVIFSADHDFQQLQSNNNVHLFNIREKKFVETTDPKFVLFDHIVKGDSGDGIPNIFSDENIFLMDGERQTTVRATKLDELYKVYKDGEDKFIKVCLDDKAKVRWEKNKTLVSLDIHKRILSDSGEPLYSEIIKAYKECKPKGNQNKFFNYCIKNGLTQLLEQSQNI